MTIQEALNKTYDAYADWRWCKGYCSNPFPIEREQKKFQQAELELWQVINDAIITAYNDGIKDMKG